MFGELKWWKQRKWWNLPLWWWLHSLNELTSEFAWLASLAGNNKSSLAHWFHRMIILWKNKTENIESYDTNSLLYLIWMTTTWLKDSYIHSFFYQSSYYVFHFIKYKLLYKQTTQNKNKPYSYILPHLFFYCALSVLYPTITAMVVFPQNLQ